MAYLIPIVLVLLVVSGFITFLVLNATKRSKPSEAENSGENDPQTMAASDPSPFGDTTEHAGEQTHQGETTDDPESTGPEVRGGHGAAPGLSPENADVPHPDSERVADRPQV
jgi:hypothetical protein